jgi:hypothetical protein
MSISHKAWLFDHAAFEAELALVLRMALQTDEPEALAAFLDRHHAALTDLETEEALPADWATGREEADVQALADLALTKFYTPSDERGLGEGFDALHAYLGAVPGMRPLRAALICGKLFGPKGRRLDPGCMGTGLLSPAEVTSLLACLETTDWPPVPEPESKVFADCHYQPESEDEVEEARDCLLALYRQARAEGKGLLFTDFNDQGVGRR